MKITRWLMIAIIMVLSISAHSRDAAKDGDWITMGVPTRIHMGTDGRFFINGTNSHGACGGVTPSYFRLDMDAPHFYAMYSWMMHMSKENKPIECIVKSGCGDDRVWVEYCSGPL